MPFAITPKVLMLSRSIRSNDWGQELDQVPNEDIQFVLDLGLCRMDPEGGWRWPIRRNNG